MEKVIVALVAITFAVILVLWIKAVKKTTEVEPGKGGALPNTEDKKEQQSN